MHSAKRLFNFIPRRLEARTDLELEALNFVTILLVEREGQRELQRAQGRNPSHTETDGVAQFAEVHVLASV